MKIYKKENDMIEVYEMSINDEAVKLYKDSLANRIKFYDIKSSDNNKLRKFDKQDIMSAGALNEYKGKYDWIFTGISDEEYGQDEILSKYIDGEYDQVSIKEIYGSNKNDFNEVLYALIPSDNSVVITRDENVGDIYALENILVLPYELYKLQMLLQGRFDKLLSKDLELFNSFYNLEYLGNLEHSLVSEIITNKEINIHSRILKKTR